MYSLLIQPRLLSLVRLRSKPYSAEVIENSAMRFRECRVLAYRILPLQSTVLQNALHLWKEIMKLHLIFFGFSRSWRGYARLPDWYFRMNTCGYLVKTTPWHYSTELLTIYFHKKSHFLCLFFFCNIVYCMLPVSLKAVLSVNL